MRILIIHGTIYYNNIGGTEIQLDLIAKYLSHHNNEVFYYIIEKSTACKKDLSSPYKIIRNLHINNNLLFIPNQINFIVSLINKYNIDLIFSRSFKYCYILHKAAKRSSIPFIYQINQDISKTIFSFRNILNNFIKNRLNIINIFLSRYYVKKATKLLAISHQGKIFFENKYNIHVELINNMHPIPKLKFSKSYTPIIITWINNIKPLKRVELFLRLAESINDNNIKFIIIGKLNKNSYSKYILKNIHKIKNLEYWGQIPLDDVNTVLEKATLNILTSKSEGFGNSNIQGWLRKTPIITTVDSSNVVEKYNLGKVANSFEELLKYVKYFLDNEKIRKTYGENARKYAISNHSVEVVGKKYLILFEETLSSFNKTNT